MIRMLLALVLGLLALGLAPAQAERRAALVIGAAEYRALPRMVRPVGDARAMRDALAALGFETSLVLDPDQAALDDAVDRFAGTLKRDDIALVYYSGHAARIGSDLVFLPVDAPPQGTRPEDLPRVRGLGLYNLGDDLKATGARAQIVIVDACRGDPYEGNASELAPSRCGELGRQMPEGSFVLFSASAGQKALDRLGPDDRDPHSLLTRILLRRLPEARSIAGLARGVREEVVEVATSVNYEQRPAFLDELSGPPVLIGAREPPSEPVREREAALPPAAEPPAEPSQRIRPRPEAPSEPVREREAALPPPAEPPAEPPQRIRPRPEGPIEVPEPRRSAEGFRCGAVAPGPPSFSCRRTTRLAEATICNDPRLGSCDRVLNEVFERAQSRLGSGAPALRREEDAWVLRRNACAETAPPGSEALTRCIGRAYDQRISELEQIAAAPAAAPQVARPSFDCRYARSSVEQAICADPVLAARDRQMARLYEQAMLTGSGRIEASQDAWRSERDACGRAGSRSLEACVENAYDRRIRELRSLLAVR